MRKELLPDMGTTRCRKMFGEHIVCVNDKPILPVWGNTVFVKIVSALAERMAGRPTGLLYEGGNAGALYFEADDFSIFLFTLFIFPSL